MNMRYKNYEIEISSRKRLRGEWHATAKVTPIISGMAAVKSFHLFVGGYNTQAGAEVEALVMSKERIDRRSDRDEASYKF